MAKFNILNGVYLGPAVYEGDLLLSNTQLKDLGNLQTVKGSLYIRNTQIKSLGNLRTVKGSLYLEGTPVTSLRNLQTVKGTLDLEDTPIKDLGNLRHCKTIYLPSGTGWESFKDVQDIIATLKAAPLEELVTMLADYEDPIFQTIIKQRLNNG